MCQNILAGSKLFLLAGLEPRLNQLLGLGFEQVFFATPLLERVPRWVGGAPGIGQAIVTFFHRPRQSAHVGERVEQIQMSFRLQQSVVLMLAVDMNQEAPYVGENRERCETAV